MEIKFEVFDPLESLPILPNILWFVPVLILLDGEREFNEGLFGQDGFSWSYDESPIKDEISLWSYLPKINQGVNNE